MVPTAVIETVQSVVEATLASAEPVDAVVISVAAYLRHGEPDDQRGAYGALRSHDLKRAPLWVHDGTAAGRAVASTSPTAVVMLGTAIGVGFAPHPSTVRAVAPGLRFG